jgi:hypothetical protein
MAIRVEQTPLVIEDQFNTGHIRVGQGSLLVEDSFHTNGLFVGQAVIILEVPGGASAILLPTIINGNFQDPLGNPLALGKVTFQLSQDAVNTTTNTSVSSKYIVSNTLTITGSITQPFNLWPNSILTTETGLTNTYYTTKAFTASGQLVWCSPAIIPNIYPTVDLDNITPQF